MRKRQNISNLSVADGNGTLQATCTGLKCHNTLLAFSAGLKEYHGS